MATEHLPARVEPRGDVEPHIERGPSIPSIPDATRAAARWIRPLVPPIVGRVIDNTTQPLTRPLRTARQVFEEVEEIAFSFKRTRKITVDTESSDLSEQPPTAGAPAEEQDRTSRIESSRDRSFPGPQDQRYEPASLAAAPRDDLAELSVKSADRGNRELAGRDGLHELRSPEGPRQLPPAD